MKSFVSAVSAAVVLVAVSGVEAVAQLDLTLDRPDHAFEAPAVVPLPAVQAATGLHTTLLDEGPAVGGERPGAVRQNILSNGRVDVFVEPQFSIDPEVDVPAASAGISIRLDQ